MKTKTVMVADIQLDDRIRQDMGDLESLAKSIDDDETGLIQPIVISPDNKLLAGERRFLAMRDVLGWDRVPCVINYGEAIAVEYIENEERKDLTAIERKKTTKAYQAWMGNRQGSRTDLTKDDDETSGDSSLPAGRPEVKKGEETRDKAAKAAGTTQQAVGRIDKVVDRDHDDLSKAVDTGAISPYQSE